MMIYAEGGTLHADYEDGAHINHYVSATVTAGQSVVFSTDANMSGTTAGCRILEALAPAG